MRFIRKYVLTLFRSYLYFNLIQFFSARQEIFEEILYHFIITNIITAEEEDFNFPDLEMLEPAPNSFTHFGRESIQAMLDNTVEKRVESKIKSKQLVFCQGAPGTRVQRERWVKPAENIVTNCLSTSDLCRIAWLHKSDFARRLWHRPRLVIMRWLLRNISYHCRLSLLHSQLNCCPGPGLTQGLRV